MCKSAERSDAIRLKHLVTFNMDEYVQLLENHSEPCHTFMCREFFSHSAAALATACKIQVTVDAGYYEVRNNDVLGTVGFSFCRTFL